MRRPQGTVIGFEVLGLHVVDVDGELPSPWSGRTSRATLGLMAASVAEIVLRARVVLAARSMPDVLAFARADGPWAAGDLADADAALREALAGGSCVHTHVCRAAWPRAACTATPTTTLGLSPSSLCQGRSKSRPVAPVEN